MLFTIASLISGVRVKGLVGIAFLIFRSLSSSLDVILHVLLMYNQCKLLGRKNAWRKCSFEILCCQFFIRKNDWETQRAQLDEIKMFKIRSVKTYTTELQRAVTMLNLTNLLIAGLIICSLCKRDIGSHYCWQQNGTAQFFRRISPHEFDSGSVAT